MKQWDNDDLRTLGIEGLAEYIHQVISFRQVEDEKLKELWKAAEDAIDEVEHYLWPQEEINHDDF